MGSIDGPYVPSSTPIWTKPTSHSCWTVAAHTRDCELEPAPNPEGSPRPEAAKQARLASLLTQGRLTHRLNGLGQFGVA